VKRVIPIVFVVFALLVTTGCATWHLVPLAEAGKAIPADSIVIVGRIVLDPELKQEWGPLDFAVKNAYERRGFPLIAKEMVPKFEDVTKADHMINAGWNDYFLAVLPKDEPLNWISVQVFLKVEGSLKDELFLNSPFKIDVRPGDRFIYLGDLVYHFNVTNQLGGKESVLEVKDGYAAAKSKLNGSILDENGKPLSLQKRIPKDVAKLTTEVLETKVTYSYY